MAARFMDRSTPIDQRSYRSARVLYEKRAGHSTIPFHSLSLSLFLSVCMIDRPDRVRVRSAEKTIVGEYSRLAILHVSRVT